MYEKYRVIKLRRSSLVSTIKKFDYSVLITLAAYSCLFFHQKYIKNYNPANNHQSQKDSKYYMDYTGDVTVIF